MRRLRQLSGSKGRFTALGARKSSSDGIISHLDDDGRPMMVDIAGKATTVREATSQCHVTFPSGILEQFRDSTGQLASKKGPIVNTAILAGVMAVKKTPNLIPLCHPLPVTHCSVSIEPCTTSVDTLVVQCTVQTEGKTGVEMEALVGASCSALTIYDMCKSLSHGIIISDLHLVKKSGGKSDFAMAGK